MTDDNLPPIDENHVIAERREKLAALRVATNNVPYPNDFKPKHKADVLQRQYAEQDKETLDPQSISATVAGRMMLKRIMGKASFATIQDGSGENAGARIQLYIARDEVV
jgi:lysyl-tRNA synthetase, class II